MTHELPVRVLELRCTYGWGGGPDKTILKSAAMHDTSILDILVVYIRSVHDHEFSLVARARSMGVRVEEIVERSPFDVALVGALLRIIDANRIQVIHSRDYKTNFLALLLRTFYRRHIRIVTMAHGWVGRGFKLGMYYTLDKVLASFFDRTFLLFSGQRAQFIRKPSLRKTFVVHNAIDHREWDPALCDRGYLRRELNLPSDRVVVGFVGRIMPEKDILTMLDVVGELLHVRCRPVVLVLVGESADAGYREQVERRVRTRSLENAVVFTGARTDLRQLYAGFDLFLMTSLQEGFPNSLLEAMAMKVPAVVSAIDGIAEILEDGTSGILCRPRDVGGFCNAIERVLADTALRERLLTTARLLVENELSFDRRLRIVEDHYLDLMGVCRPNGSRLW